MIILAAVCIAAATLTRELDDGSTDCQLMEAIFLFTSFIFLIIGVANL